MEELLERPAGTWGEVPDKSRELQTERAPEPKQKSVEMDLGMQYTPVAVSQPQVPLTSAYCLRSPATSRSGRDRARVRGSGARL